MAPLETPVGDRPDAGVKSFGVGVIGVGRIGRLHADLIDRQIEGVSLAGVYDPADEIADEIAARHGTRNLDSAEALIDDPAVDVVAICSSTDTHADLIVAAAEAGKAIFCEKPVSLDLSEVDRALDAVAANGVPFGIGFNRRFDPAHNSVHQAVADGLVGDVHLIRISSRDPAPPPLEYVKVSGGIFLDMTIHDFDMARFVAGSEVKEVFARGSLRIEPSFAEADDVDTAVVTLVHEDGCLTTIDNSRQAVYGFDQRVEAFGSKGVASSLNPLAHTGVVQTAAGTSAPPLPYFFLDRYIPSYLHEWRAFIEALQAGEAPPVAARDARMPLVIGLAAWRSLREGRTVATAEIEAEHRG